MDTPDARFDELAARQHGVGTRDQARAVGLTDRMIRTRVANGRLEVPVAGVLLIPGAPTTWHQRLLVAVLAGGPNCIASHRAAAALHRLDGFRPGPPSRGGAGRGRDGRVEREELRYVREYLRCQGRNGLGPIGGLLDRRRGNQPRSVLERRMLRLLEAHGRPRPLCQYRVVRPDGQLADLDFAYPEHRVANETDSHVGHATRRQRQNDARRQNQVVLDGWRVLRFDWDDVTRRPAYVAEVVLSALHRSGVVS